jgi:hypothetical protein
MVEYQSMHVTTGLEGAFLSQREKFRVSNPASIQFNMTTYRPPIKRAVRKAALSLLCPTCGAKPGERCRHESGLQRGDPHRDRRKSVTGLNKKSR